MGMAWPASLLEEMGVAERKRLLGLCFILAVAVIWVVASFVVQDIESTGAHPLVLTYVANSLFAIYVPLYFLNLRIKTLRAESAAANAASKASQVELEQEDDVLMASGVLRSDQVPNPVPPARMGTRPLLIAALVVSACLCGILMQFNGSFAYILQCMQGTS
jgi:hypothetical protein